MTHERTLSKASDHRYSGALLLTVALLVCSACTRIQRDCGAALSCGPGSAGAAEQGGTAGNAAAPGGIANAGGPASGGEPLGEGGGQAGAPSLDGLAGNAGHAADHGGMAGAHAAGQAGARGDGAAGAAGAAGESGWAGSAGQAGAAGESGWAGSAGQAGASAGLAGLDAPAVLRIRQGETMNVDVTFARPVGLDQPLSVSLVGLPERTASQPVPLEPGSSRVTLQLQVDLDCTPGGPTRVTFRVTDPGTGTVLATLARPLYVAQGPGVPDKSFGPEGDGIVADALRRPDEEPTSLSYPSDAACDAQGRVTVVGTVVSDTSTQGRAVRLLPDGDIDAGFGDAGVEGFGLPASDAQHLVLDSSGLVVHARIRNGANEDAYSHYLRRLLLSGAVDPAFGNEGDVALGEIVQLRSFLPFGAGWLGAPTDGPVFALDRDGKSLAGFDAQAASGLGLAAVDSQGRILYASTATEGAYVIGRLLHTGAVDLTFGSGGLVTFPWPTGTVTGVPHQLLASPNGSIVLVVESDLGHSLGGELALLATSAEGTVLPGFEESGRLVVASPARAAGAFVQADDRIVVVWTQQHTPSASSYFVRRYLPSGELDPTFASEGTLSTRLAGKAVYDADAHRAVLIGQPQLLRLWL